MIIELYLKDIKKGLHYGGVWYLLRDSMTIWKGCSDYVRFGLGIDIGTDPYVEDLHIRYHEYYTSCVLMSLFYMILMS